MRTVQAPVSALRAGASELEMVLECGARRRERRARAGAGAGAGAGVREGIELRQPAAGRRSALLAPLLALLVAPASRAEMVVNEMVVNTSIVFSVEVLRFSELMGEQAALSLVKVPLVRLRHNPCSPLDAEAAREYAGAMVLLGNLEQDEVRGLNGCPFEVRLQTLAAAGAVAALSALGRGVPGRHKWWTENLGDVGREIPLLAVGPAFLQQLQAGPLWSLDGALSITNKSSSRRSSTASSTPSSSDEEGDPAVTVTVVKLDGNPWEAMLELYYPVIVVVLSAIYVALAVKIVRQAFWPLSRLPSWSARRAKLIDACVLYSIALCLLVTTVLSLLYLVCGITLPGAALAFGHGVLPEVRLSVKRLFEGATLGSDSFTTVLLVLHWAELRSAAVDHRRPRNILVTRWGVILLCLAITSLPFLVRAVPNALYLPLPATGVVAALAALLVLSSSAWLLYSLRSFTNMITGGDASIEVPRVLLAYVHFGREAALVNISIVLFIVIVGPLVQRPAISAAWVAAIYLMFALLAYIKLQIVCPPPHAHSSVGPRDSLAVTTVQESISKQDEGRASAPPDARESGPHDGLPA